MILRDAVARLLEENSLSEISKELSVALSRMSAIAMEQGDTVYSERLESAANAMWDIESFGV
jgi:hypothetical protein